MFEAEAAGLEELRSAKAVRVPHVLAVGATDTEAFLALEWIDFGRAVASAESLLGEQLARQHRETSETFGWHRANFIGSTPQINEPLSEPTIQARSGPRGEANGALTSRLSSAAGVAAGGSRGWVEFFRERRLGYQLGLAKRNGYDGRLQEEGAELLSTVGAFFEDYQPLPSLLHGDLWGGNWATDSAGAPVIFDPAVYYGDREADLAMTRLFGGFSTAFYRAYEAAWPLARGSEERVTLYNLYHVLNHLNLFGESYLPQAHSMISRLLSLTR
jgi:fructosamine-3-kinase